MFFYEYLSDKTYQVLDYILYRCTVFHKISCQVDFGEEAAWLGAWCGLERCFGNFLFFWAVVHSCRFLVADPLALLDF